MSKREKTYCSCGLILVAAMVFLTGSQSSRAHVGHDHSTPSPVVAAERDGQDATAKTIAFLEARVTANPRDTISLSKLAVVRLRLARQAGQHAMFEAAERDFRDLLARDDHSKSGGVGLAYALLGQHRFKDALQVAREAAESMPEDQAIWALLGDLHFALGNYVEAEMAYSRLLAHGLTLQSLARMSQIQELRGRHDQAEGLMHDALEAGKLLNESPTTLAWCRTMLGDLALRRGRLSDAESHYRVALDMDESAHVPRWRLAEIAAKSGRLEEAERALRDLVVRAPLPTYWIALGDVLTQQFQPDEAAQWRRRAEDAMLAELKDGDAGHVRELATFWLTHDGDAELALELALADLESVRADVGAYETVAWAMHKAGRSDEAVEYVRKALRPGPGSASLLFLAADIFRATSNDQEAARLEQQAHRLNPNLAAEANARPR